MRCARCGEEPDADLIRFASFDGDEELSSLFLCPGCSYRLNTLLAAFVSSRPVSGTF